MKQLMMEGRLVMDNEMNSQNSQHRFNKGKSPVKNSSKDQSIIETQKSLSELTIYDRAVHDETNDNKSDPNYRKSSLSEEPDTSDETIMHNPELNFASLNHQFNANAASIPNNLHNIPIAYMTSGSFRLEIAQETQQPQQPQPGPSGYRPVKCQQQHPTFEQEENRNQEQQVQTNKVISPE